MCCMRLTLVVEYCQRGHSDTCVQHLQAVRKGDEEANREEDPTKNHSMPSADPPCGKRTVRFIASVFFQRETLVRDVEVQDV